MIDQNDKGKLEQPEQKISLEPISMSNTTPRDSGTDPPALFPLPQQTNNLQQKIQEEISSNPHKNNFELSMQHIIINNDYDLQGDCGSSSVRQKSCSAYQLAQQKLQGTNNILPSPVAIASKTNNRNEGSDNLCKTKFILDFNNNEDLQILNETLQKPIKNELDTEMIKRSLLQIGFFQQVERTIDLNHFYSLINCMQIEIVQRGDIVFNYGSVGDKYYIIVRGSVLVLLKQKYGRVIDKQERRQRFLRLRKQMRLQAFSTPNSPEGKQQPSSLSLGQGGKNIDGVDKVSSGCLHHPLYIEQQQNQQLTFSQTFGKSLMPELTQKDITRMFPHFINVATHQAGEAFGEYSLLRNIKRTATIIAREDTCLITINKANYIKYLSGFQEKVLSDKINFLRSFDLFRKLDEKLNNLILCLSEVHYQLGNIVYKEGDQADRLFLIQEGDIEMSQTEQPILGTSIQQQKGIICKPGIIPATRKLLQPKEAQVQAIDKQMQNLDQQLQLESMIKYNEQKHSFFSKEPVQLIKNWKEISSGSTRESKRQVLSIQGQNTYFGEAELISDSNCRQQQARVVSTSAKLLVISKQNLLFFSKLGNNLMQSLVELQRAKDMWHESKITNTSAVQQEFQKQYIQYKLQRDKEKMQSKQQEEERYKQNETDAGIPSTQSKGKWQQLPQQQQQNQKPQTQSLCNTKREASSHLKNSITITNNNKIYCEDQSVFLYNGNGNELSQVEPTVLSNLLYKLNNSNVHLMKSSNNTNNIRENIDFFNKSGYQDNLLGTVEQLPHKQQQPTNRQIQKQIQLKRSCESAAAGSRISKYAKNNNNSEILCQQFIDYNQCLKLNLKNSSLNSSRPLTAANSPTTAQCSNDKKFAISLQSTAVNTARQNNNQINQQYHQLKSFSDGKSNQLVNGKGSCCFGGLDVSDGNIKNKEIEIHNDSSIVQTLVANLNNNEYFSKNSPARMQENLESQRINSHRYALERLTRSEDKVDCSNLDLSQLSTIEQSKKRYVPFRQISQFDYSGIHKKLLSMDENFKQLLKKNLNLQKQKLRLQGEIPLTLGSKWQERSAQVSSHKSLNAEEQQILMLVPDNNNSSNETKKQLLKRYQNFKQLYAVLQLQSIVHPQENLLFQTTRQALQADLSFNSGSESTDPLHYYMMSKKKQKLFKNYKFSAHQKKRPQSHIGAIVIQ